MILNVQARLDYLLSDDTDVLLQIEAASDDQQKVIATKLDMGTTNEFARVAAEDGVGERIWLRASGQLLCDYRARIEVNRKAEDIAALAPLPLHHLPGDTVKYLMDSRYCPAGEFQSFVNAEFGHLQGGARIAALRDWIENHFEYLPGASNSLTTALDTFVQRQGVCRDFAHVLITLVRASAIPARIASVYALGIEPEDFHAVVDVYLDGRWHLIDPSGMATADKMVRIGVGRDAADIAFMTSFGQVTMNAQNVMVSEGD